MLAWHFVQKDGRLRDSVKNVVSTHCGQKVYPGLTLEVPGLPVCDQWGLHASLHPAQASFHAPSLLLCRVKLGGQIAQREAEVCATRRTVLWMLDASVPFWRWACWRLKLEVERERQKGARLSCAFDELLAAKFHHASGCGPYSDFEKWRGPARRAARDLCGLDSHAKPTRTPTQWAGLGYEILALCQGHHRSVTPRLANYFLSEPGKSEALKLEEMVLAFKAQSDEETRRLQVLEQLQSQAQELGMGY